MARIAVRHPSGPAPDPRSHVLVLRLPFGGGPQPMPVLPEPSDMAGRFTEGASLRWWPSTWHRTFSCALREPIQERSSLHDPQEGESPKSIAWVATTGAEIANTMQQRPIFGQRCRPLG